jgi:adenosylcobinamide kinase/adenosylcobinamide-phosphate guanylyltransferase
MAVILITGGARSGKSAHAEKRARSFPGRPVYIATAEALDAEMEARIEKHRRRRSTDWIEREVPLDLLQALIETDGGGPRLVDCLTLWLSNMMHAQRNCIVPDNALARSFRDAAGFMNQAIAAVADEAEFVVAGLPMKLK